MVNRAENQWWTLHYSEEPDTQAVAISCYLDESATDGSTPTAVVGGLLLNRDGYRNLDSSWGIMLDEFGLRPALHMKDFGRHGRFCDMPLNKNIAIFERVTEIILEERAYTMSATLRHAEYLSLFSAETRADHSPYELCFIVAALGVGRMAVLNDYTAPIPYVVDLGNPYWKQVFLAHREMEYLHRLHNFPRNMGALAFQDDTNVSALQAADVVCWGARRIGAEIPLPLGMVAIQKLLEGEFYASLPIEREAMIALENYFEFRRDNPDEEGLDQYVKG